LEATTGAVLENIVYTRSKVSHYFVMTPTRRCLEDCGVLRDPAARPILSPSNVDRTALDGLVRRIVGFRFREGNPPRGSCCCCRQRGHWRALLCRCRTSVVRLLQDEEGCGRPYFHGPSCIGWKGYRNPPVACSLGRRCTCRAFLA
jgi:hypothetical protein